MLATFAQSLISISPPGVVIPGAPPGDPPVVAGSRRVLSVEVPASEKTRWCWAAVALAICEAYQHGGLTQCLIASQVLEVDCCSDPEDECDRRGSLEAALDLPEHHHVGAISDRPGARTWEYITAMIDAYTPLAALMRSKWGAGHFVAVYGYDQDETGLRQVMVGDPRSDRATYPLDEFTLLFEDDSHWETTYETQGAGKVQEA